jgi:tRNA A-37 threonylcarbamoyl transferase component Bud32
MSPIPAEDHVAEWLVQWEEALTTGQPPPSLDQLPPALHARARAGVRLLRGFAGMPYALASTDSDPPADAPPRRPPDTPRYHFEEFLARGGMGEVWRAHDAVLHRDVALKVLRQQLLGGDQTRARFEAEARLVGQLEHPSIVPVRDLGELPDGRPFFAMKLIQGRTLADLFEGRATSAEDLPRWVEVFEHICRAVAFAHARGLIHRDLKPSNVMLGEFGEVQVMDWGIAKALATDPPPPSDPATRPAASPALRETTDSEGVWTQPGQVKGTPAFMAPEQARGEVERIGSATDVFGLGGILCVILTGQPPVARTGPAVGDLAEAFARLDGCGADAELIALAKACLAPEPEARPADAADVARRVKAYRDGVAERRRQAERERGAAGARVAAARTLRRRRVALAAILGAMLLGGAILWPGQRPGVSPGDGARGDAERELEERVPPLPVGAGPPAAEEARARLREQALTAVRAEVATQAKRLSSDRPSDVADARQVLEVLLRLPGLAGARDPDALAQLPEPERQAWQQVWREVAELLQRSSPAR